MDYFKHYNKLIERSKCRLTNGSVYYELHHIIPRCLGGDDSPDNLVYLTPEEHYVAHQLLVKMYPNNGKLAFAANMMCTNRPSNKLYGWLRRRVSDNMKSNNPNAGGHSRREYNKRNGSPNIGYRHSEETKKILSEQRKGSKNPNADGKARLTITTLVHEDTGEVIQYSSLKEAEAAHKANHASVHYNRKRGCSYRGYFWYVGDEYKSSN